MTQLLILSTVYLFLFLSLSLSLYRLDPNILSISPWICQFPVHHAVEKCKTIQCSAICVMTTMARKNVTRTLIRLSGKSISWSRVKILP